MVVSVQTLDACRPPDQDLPVTSSFFSPQEVSIGISVLIHNLLRLAGCCQYGVVKDCGRRPSQKGDPDRAIRASALPVTYESSMGVRESVIGTPKITPNPISGF